jgi:hypothetical protein
MTKSAVRFSSLTAAMLLASIPLLAEPIVLQSNFDPTAGPNQYEVQFPIQLGGGTIFMPIVGGTFDLETDAVAGTSRILAWSQQVDAIEIFGMSTGPITIDVDTSKPSTGTFDPATQHFNVTATFLINFDDTQLSQVGFFSPLALEGSEDGNIYGVGSIGTIRMFLEGQGSVAGSSFSYTCSTSARFEYILDEAHAQPGDSNHDKTIDISDPVTTLSGLFLGGSIPCPSAAEVNGDGTLDISDVVYLLDFLFQGGPVPPAAPVDCSAGA